MWSDITPDDVTVTEIAPKSADRLGGQKKSFYRAHGYLLFELNRVYAALIYGSIILDQELDFSSTAFRVSVVDYYRCRNECFSLFKHAISHR